jgi:hypothetical protein
MLEALTQGGIELAISLSADKDRVPITLQVLEDANVTNISNSSSTSSVARVEALLSDGKYFSRVVLIKKLHSLVTPKQLHRGAIVQMTNYISQPLDYGKQAVICLDISVLGMSETMIGNPSEYLQPVLPVDSSPEFVGRECDGVCNYCQEDPCDWSLLGRTIVDSVRADHQADTMDEGMRNKTYRYAAYRTYAQVKYGYLGKGNRKPLPLCVTNGIRDTFPDPHSIYVGFHQSNE